MQTRQKLTFLVFKDHLAPRALRISENWIYRMGWTLGFVILLAIGAIGLGVGAWWKAEHAGIPTPLFGPTESEKTEELQKKFDDLQAAYERLAQSKAPGASTAIAPAAAIPTGSAFFSAIPLASVKSPLPAKETLPFRLEAMKAQWRGSSLSLTTAIEYTKEDGGNQQGHFILLARGPSRIFAYPDQAFSPAGTDTLINPEHGEYFSVSRYREVKAAFGPVVHREDIQAIEVLIFDGANALIYADRIAVEGLKPARAAPAAPKETPEKAEAAPSSPTGADTAAPAAPAAAPTSAAPGETHP